MFSLVYTNQAVFADDTISVDLSPEDVNLEVMPEVFNSVNQSLTISTTSLAGYVVNIAPSGSTNALVNQSDPTITIPTFTLSGNSTSLPANATGYGYGFSIDGGTNYLPVPAPNTSRTIFESDSASTDQYDLTFGAIVQANQPKGTYTNSVIITAIAKLEPCPAGNICYYGNGDDGTGTMDNQSASSNVDTVLIAPNYSRPGYGFAGWNTALDGTGTDYGPNQTINPGDLSLEGLQLYAKWVPSTGTLQGWTGCSDLAQGEVTALTDTRDNNTYAVGKFADGVCWMMENLRLDFSNPNLEISGMDTNRPSAEFIDKINDEHPASSNSFCAASTSGCINTLYYNTNNTNRNLDPSYDANNNSSSWYSYGNYYNWYTLTAGHGKSSVSEEGAGVDGDICPANWRLPAGFSNIGDLAILDISLNGDGKNHLSDSKGVAASKRWRTYPLNFIYSGEQRGSSAANRSTSNSYATLNTSSSDRTMNLWLKQDTAGLNSNTTYKYRGQTVRCIFNEGYHVKGNIHYDANGGTGTMADVTNIDFGTELAANNEFTKPYSSFVSWNTQSDGKGVVVYEGGMVAGAADRMHITEGETLTLYAIWASQYSLEYDGNGATAGMMNPARISNLELGYITLSDSNLSYPSHGFAGWSFDPDASTKLLNGTTVQIYGPNERVKVDASFLAHADPVTNRVTLYAVWIPEDTTYTMQTFGASECAVLDIGEVIALSDERDNNTYMIAKLPDNNCWTTENLRLVPSVTTLDSTNTNLPTADFTRDAPSSSSSNTLCNEENSTCIDQIGYNTTAIDFSLPSSPQNTLAARSWYGYGVMYNWYTATAGNGTYDTVSTNVAGDICPKGWRIPTGGSLGEFDVLNNLINGGSNATDAGLVKFPANFTYSGDFNTDRTGGRSTYGRFWSATPNGNKTAFRMGVTAGGATPTGSFGKWDAFAVRCIVK